MRDGTQLGDSDIDVSRIGFGCCPMGGHGWGHTQQGDLERAIEVGLDHGVNFFDTADIYGLGKSEEILGGTLIGRRHEAVIATKFGVRRNARGTFHDSSPEWIESALEASLRRLRTDYIDLYQLHGWDGQTDADAILEALERARTKGQILRYGVTNVDLRDWKRVAWDRFRLVSFSFQHSLADRSNEEIIGANREELGLSFLSWGSLGQGILSGKYDRTVSFPEQDRRRRAEYGNFHGQRLQDNLVIVEHLEKLSGKYEGRSIVQIALRWILDHVPDSVALVGVKKPAQIVDSAGALGWKLESEDVKFLEKISDHGSRTKFARPG